MLADVGESHSTLTLQWLLFSTEETFLCAPNWHVMTKAKSREALASSGQTPPLRVEVAVDNHNLILGIQPATTLHRVGKEEA